MNFMGDNAVSRQKVGYPKKKKMLRQEGHQKVAVQSDTYTALPGH